MKKEEFKAIAILIGTVIGAGILGIPAVISQVGFLIGALIMLIIGVATMFINLYLGEIVLRTKKRHELGGYAAKYLGKWGKLTLTASMFIIVCGAMVAYILGEGNALAALFNVSNPFFFGIVFFIVMTTLLFFGLKAVADSELLFGAVMIAIILLISFLAFPFVNTENLGAFDFNPLHLFIPYGVILFAFLGAESIPEVVEELKKNKRKIKKVIMIGSLAPLLIYLLFTAVVVGSVGLDGFSDLPKDQRVATIPLGQLIGPRMNVLGNVFAVFSMATSYLALGLALIWMLNFDYKINRKVSWVVISLIPLIIVLMNITNFLDIMNFTGAIAGGVQGILIVLMFSRAKLLGERKPEYTMHRHKLLSLFLILLFVLGIIYQFM